MPEHDFPPRTDRRPLADADGGRSSRQTRPQGVATVRRWSNWSLAALVVGVAGGTAALARTIPSHAASTTTTVPSTATTGTVGTAGSTGAATTSPGAALGAPGAPSAPKPIAVTSPSGVTTYVMPSTASGGASKGTAPGAGATYVVRGDT